MQNIEKLHTKAMDLAEEAFFAQKKGDHSKAVNLFKKALKVEEKAANLLPLVKNSEPTRSILYRSAASIAYHAGEYELADRLIANGLSGYPPNEIKNELKNLYEDINFMRHLSTQGITMDSSQWLMTISGKATRYGGASAEHLMGRVDVITKLFYRTVERLSKLPYRIRSGVSKEIKDTYGLYINSFIPGSFAVSFQIGYPDLQLPIFPEVEKKNQVQVEPSEIVDEMMKCFEIFENDDPDSLKMRFDDDNYFENFVGLAKQIAPDGENINLVGFTSIREGHEKPIALRKSSKQLVELSNIHSKDATDEENSEATYTGILTHL
ncbi:MAG: hypothetical protein GY749_38670 [Desulfobacteraceae bacterium]|nr:hypothetical protein [Desulfobacteraceae bacterium]